MFLFAAGSPRLFATLRRVEEVFGSLIPEGTFLGVVFVDDDDALGEKVENSSELLLLSAIKSLVAEQLSL